MFYLTKTPFFLPWFYPGLVWKKEPGTNLYLTFDDGPVPGATTWVLQILAERNIKATFFCVGDNVRKHPEILHQLIDGGHSIGNHTFNHLNGWRSSLNEYVENVNICDEELRKYGVESSLFRPPYGKIKRAQVDVLKRKFNIVMWDVLSGDFNLKLTSEKCLKRTIKATTDGSVIVFHDNDKSLHNLKKVLPAYLDHFLAKGYKFLPL
jgi:peptidoglycan/xylan/chitin deacetylase (PgdA/CDA1 family)